MTIPLLLLLALPGPCDEPEARGYDFWIGEWNVDNRWQADSGEWRHAGRATNHVFHVLDGCAVVELWDGNLNGNHLRGFSVRAWDPQTREWVLVLNWPRPGRPEFNVLRGTFRHGRGEFFRETTSAEGRPALIRFTFSDISAGTVRWNDGTSLDAGRTWSTRWIMEFTRRDARTDPPLRNVPLADPGRTRLCSADRARAFDGFLGTWQSDRARLHSMAILGECAIIDQLEWQGADGGHREALFVRALADESGDWVQYAIDTDRRRFVRFTGPGPAELLDDDGAQSMRWTPVDDGSRMRLEWAGAPGGTGTFELERAR